MLHLFTDCLLRARRMLGSEDIAVKTQTQFLICSHFSQSGRQYTHETIYHYSENAVNTINT